MMNMMDDMPIPEAASSAPTDDAVSFDSDSLIDPPIQNIGDVEDVTFDKKVKKEILEVGEGVKKPQRQHLATIIYKAYFFDHQEIESSMEEPIQLPLGDLSWPEGLWLGIEKMRKNEKAKIKIQKKYGFGRKEDQTKLRFPKGFEEGEARELLLKKGIIYEVKLLDWVERLDIEGDGNFLKAFINKPAKRQWEKPQERDEILLNLKISQGNDKILLEKNNWETTMQDSEITLTIRKVLESMKRNEKSTTLVMNTFVTAEDQELRDKLGDDFDSDKDLTIEAELLKLVKVEDWFKDGGSSLKRTLRKGKGTQPSTDSTIKVMMRIKVNDKEVLNNFPEGDPMALLESMTEEQRKEHEENPALFTFKLDDYKLSSLLIKVLKSMKKNEICEFLTDKVEKLRTNFANEYFDQYQLFNLGDKVSFQIALYSISKDQYFYQLSVADKLARVQHLKGVAGSFFKLGSFVKAGKIYQKINGYYNFGDTTNNYLKEDESSPEFQQLNTELQGIKMICFLNLVVCKHKLKEWQSIVNITDQILEMDPNNVKCLYFRGLAQMELQEHENSINTLTKLTQVDPNHVDGRNALAKAKKVRKDFLDDQHRKYSKMFN